MGLIDAVKGRIEPDVQGKIDGSVLGRFAIATLLKCHTDAPDQLARLLGFEVKNNE